MTAGAAAAAGCTLARVRLGSKSTLRAVSLGVARCTVAATVGNRIDDRQADATSIGFDEGCCAVEEAGGDSDHLPSEVAVDDLVLHAVDAQRGVLAHETLGADHGGLTKDVGVYADLLVTLGEDRRGRAPEDARVWSCLVVAREPGVELLVELRERRHVTKVVECLASKRAPQFRDRRSLLPRASGS